MSANLKVAGEKIARRSRWRTKQSILQDQNKYQNIARIAPLLHFYRQLPGKKLPISVTHCALKGLLNSQSIKCRNSLLCYTLSTINTFLGEILQITSSTDRTATVMFVREPKNLQSAPLQERPRDQSDFNHSAHYCRIKELEIHIERCNLSFNNRLWRAWYHGWGSHQ